MTTFDQEKICSICRKPVVSGKARTDVTRFLASESRCQCLIPGVDEYQRELQSEEARLNAEVLEKHDLKLKFVEQDTNRRRLKSSTATELVEVADPLDVLQRYLPDKYKIVDIIGEGGMGVVVKASCSDIAGEFVAIKIMRPQLVEDAEARARFEREAELASKLDHPNIVKIIDYGAGNLNALYIVMEYIEGQSLDSILAREVTLKTKRALDLFIQIAEGLAYAHELQILHRDIKPANLLIENRNGIETVKIVDFGIARAINSADEKTQGLTRTGELIGSPEYMSPEQILGNKLTELSDIYSLGCVMYKTLSGATPFYSDNPVRIMLRHVEETALPVASKAKEMISPDLNYIVMSCVDSHPKARYEAKALAKAIQTRRSGQKLVRPTENDYTFTQVTIHTSRDSDGVVHRTYAMYNYTKDGYVKHDSGPSQKETDVLTLCAMTFLFSLVTGFIATSILFSHLAK